VPGPLCGDASFGGHFSLFLVMVYCSKFTSSRTQEKGAQTPHVVALLEANSRPKAEVLTQQLAMGLTL
jgi:hypothetical protein